MEKSQKSSPTIKYLIGLIVVILLRLVPHPPNVEPIMATMMPFAKRWGWLAGMTFTFLAMISFDLMTNTLGIWSLFTIGTYMALGVVAGIYFKHRSNSFAHYVGFAIVGTIIYDAITGIVGSSLFFGMPVYQAFIGQIHFTMYHLAGNIVLAAVVSPALYKWVLKNPKLETGYMLSKLKLV
jgi:uncharacterized membrane protein